MQNVRRCRISGHLELGDALAQRRQHAGRVRLGLDPTGAVDICEYLGLDGLDEALGVGSPPAANARLSPTLQQRGAHERSELLVGDSAVGPLGLNPRFRRAVVVSTRDQMLDRFVITAGRQSHVCGLALARLSSRLNMAVLDHVTQVLLVRDQVWGEN